VIYCAGWALTERERAALALVPETTWEAAIDGKGEVREHRAGDACADRRCAHRACWIEDAHVTELTGLLREGPAGDQLKAWPASMRLFARRERPHPGAQLTLFEAQDGWRYCLWATDRPVSTRGWLGWCAYIDAAHRVHARTQDVIRTGKDTGPGSFPSLNQARLDASMTACILLAWLRPLASRKRCAIASCTPLPGWCAAAGGDGWKSPHPGPEPRRSRPPGSGSARYRKHPDQPLTVPASKEGNPGPAESRPPGPTAGRSHTRTPNPAPGHGPPH
jgi:hypothetical protein